MADSVGKSLSFFFPAYVSFQIILLLLIIRVSFLLSIYCALSNTLTSSYKNWEPYLAEQKAPGGWRGSKRKPISLIGQDFLEDAAT